MQTWLPLVVKTPSLLAQRPLSKSIVKITSDKKSVTKKTLPHSKNSQQHNPQNPDASMDETRYAKIAPIVLKVIHQSESFKSLTKASKKRLIDALTEKVGEVKDFRQAERGDLLVFATSAKQQKQIL